MHTALFCSKLKKIVLLSVSAALCFAGGGLDAAPGKKGTAKMQKVQKVQKVFRFLLASWKIGRTR